MFVVAFIITFVGMFIELFVMFITNDRWNVHQNDLHNVNDIICNVRSRCSFLHSLERSLECSFHSFCGMNVVMNIDNEHYRRSSVTFIPTFIAWFFPMFITNVHYQRSFQCSLLMSFQGSLCSWLYNNVRLHVMGLITIGTLIGCGRTRIPRVVIELPSTCHDIWWG